jgi:VCBS repeat-containing protein
MATFNANSNPPTTDGRDDIIGTVDADVIEALEGNDDISGLGGDDNIDAGDGNDDVVAGDGNDTVIAGEGSDKVLGGAGDDSLSGGDGKDKLYGGGDNDIIHGGDDKDRVIGGAGDDTLNGGLGSDKIYGGVGNDVIYGGSSGGPLLDDKKDLIYGGAGSDSIWGGAGNDRIMGEEGDDDLNGDDGDDKLDGGVGNDSLTGGTGEDDLKGKDGNDMLSGESDDDTLRGNSGEDTLYGGSGDDRFFGGKNNDLIYGDGDFFNGVDVDGAFGGDDDIKGGHGADTIYGEGGDDEIDGHKGHDYIHGGQGDDHILGGKGDDTLKGHLGDDFIDGEQHDDLFLHDLDHEVNDSDVYEGDHGIDTIRWYVTQDTWFSTDLQEDRLGYLSDKDDVRSEDHDGEKDDDELDLQNWDLNLSGFEHLEIEVDTTDNGDGTFGVAGGYDHIELNTPADRTDHDDLTDTTRKFFDNVAVYNNEVVLTDDDLNVSLGNVVIDEDDTADFTFDTSVLENDDIEDWVLSMSMDTAGVRGNIITQDGTGAEIFIGSELNPQSFIDYGRFSYNVNDQWEALAQGETAEETFTYTVQDASHAVNGDEDTATVKITVTGRNDTHTFDGASEFDNFGANVKGNGSVETRNMSITDTDSSDDHDWSFDAGVLGDHSEAGTYGTWSISGITNGTHTLHDATDSSANWNYTLSGAAYEALHEGQTLTDTITVYVTSDNGADAAGDDQISQLITVHIEGENDGPTLAAGNVVTNEETPASIDLSALGNDVDNDDDGSSLTYTIIGAVDGVSIGGGGTSLEMNPATFYDDLNDGDPLAVDVIVRATDTYGASVDQTMTFNLMGVNDDPTLAADSDTINEDSSSTIDLSALGGDLDDEDDGITLTYSIVGAVPGASVVGTDLIYNAAGLHDALDAGDSTDVVITVRATDAQVATVETDMTVTVQGVNDAPVVNASVLGVNEGSDNTADLTALASDVDGDDTPATLTYSITGGSGAAYASILGGDLTFDADHVDFDSLNLGETQDLTVTYKANDGDVDSNVETITVTVTGINDAPTLVDGAGAVDEDSSTTVDLKPLGDDADDEDNGNSLTYSIVSGPAKGTANIAGGVLTFNTNGDFENLDAGNIEAVAITFKAMDTRTAVSTTQTVVINVTGVNDAPVFANDILAVSENGSNNVDLSVGLSDADADDDATTMSYSIDSNGGFGTASVDADGVLTYDSNGLYEGLDDFETADFIVNVEADDGNGGTDLSSVTVTINGANDAPEEIAVGNLDLGTINEGSSFIFINAVMTDDSTDVDGEVLTITATGLSSHGATISVDGLGNVTYDASAVVVAADEIDTFTFTVSDGTASYDATAEIDIINI